MSFLIHWRINVGFLNKVSSWVYRVANWPLLAAAALIFIFFTVLILPGMAGNLADLTGVEISPDTSILYSADDLYAMAEAYGSEGRGYYIYSRYTFDVAWPLVYLLFLTTSISCLFRSLPVTKTPWRLINLLPLAGAVLDLLENNAASLVMYRYPLPTPIVAHLAPVFTFLKWIVIGFCFIALAGGILLRVQQYLKNK